MMESNFRLVMGAAVVGIFLGVAGLVFGIVSKNKADELRSDFSQVETLVEKIRQVEDSSSGISAGAARIKREVDSLRDGTQGALNQVSDEMTRLRRDLNNSIQMARDLEQRIMEFANPPAPPEEEPLPVTEEPEFVEDAEVAEEAETDGEVTAAPDPGSDSESTPVSQETVYVIKSGDNLSRVAAAHEISLARLMEANPDVEPLRLQIGQEILIPVP